MLILKVGHIMSVGYEKVMLLYNPNTYETADIISTYVYRKGIGEGGQFSYSSAVGLFSSVLNFILIVGTNYISKKTNEVSLW
jgi:putative aldouronate transport system permease protein